jgi:hypothetical protein
VDAELKHVPAPFPPVAALIHESIDQPQSQAAGLSLRKAAGARTLADGQGVEGRACIADGQCGEPPVIMIGPLEGELRRTAGPAGSPVVDQVGQDLIETEVEFAGGTRGKLQPPAVVLEPVGAAPQFKRTGPQVEADGAGGDAMEPDSGQRCLLSLLLIGDHRNQIIDACGFQRRPHQVIVAQQDHHAATFLIEGAGTADDAADPNGGQKTDIPEIDDHRQGFDHRQRGELQGNLFHPEHVEAARQHHLPQLDRTVGLKDIV